MRENRKWAYILPNTFTALNLAFGVGSTLASIQGDYYKACLMIVLGIIFDSADGRVARMVGSESSFGEQFDSMSDLLSFGVAPAILIHQKYLTPYGRVGVAICFFMVLCTALRLARFNVTASSGTQYSDYFQGLPTPVASMGIVGFVFFDLEFRDIPWIQYGVMPYVILYSILMISNIPYPSFKNSAWFRSHQKFIFIIIVLFLMSLFLYGEVVLGVMTLVYVIGNLFYVLLNRKKYKNFFKNKAEDSSEEILD